MAHVLVIDDSSTTRLYYRDVLEGARFQVAEALNGIEGLEKAVSDHFDLFIVDLNMPKMDGYTFLDHVRRMADLQATPVIMISTENRPEDKQRAFAVGANLYLTKPVDPHSLVAHVSLLAGLQPQHRPVAA